LTTFPDHPFWDFSLALYAAPAVAEACLRLQDRRGLDVNLLLFACWTAATGGARLSADEWRRLIDGTEAWRSQVVEPLRAMRRYLKDAATTPQIAALHERVKALELDAEHAAQLNIAALAGHMGAAAPVDALSALQEYVGVLGVALSDADRKDLALIAARAAANAPKM
jgi:uncharacterized protein (TIGR02444 family)